MERRLYLVHGRVQGVGFRATTAGIARRFAVTGWVRNLPNGSSVEIVAQGEPGELDTFFAAVAARFARNIDRTDQHRLRVVVPEESAFIIDY